ncbi:MAG: TetR/AcrR family transcriptional regulator [Solirubrobacteraceae bacterium]
MAGAVAAPKAPVPDWHLATPGGSHPQLAEIQRARLLSAAIRAVDEVGWANTSVGHITARARVSRRTFYELFADREACLYAALEGVLLLIEGELAEAGLDGLSWRERIRTGLWTILNFFDREPLLAQACVVQALQGGPEVLVRREAIFRRLASIVDEGRLESVRASECGSLTAEGLVGAGFSILYARLSHGEPAPLGGLLGELTGMIVLPYLGATAAKREQARPTPAPTNTLAGRHPGMQRLAADPLEGLQLRLTYRTTRVLECVAAHPGWSNRRLGEDAGMADQGQISKLLGRLERVGLIANTSQGHLKGDANAWQLTDLGRRVTERLNLDTQLQHSTNTTKETQR